MKPLSVCPAGSTLLLCLVFGSCGRDAAPAGPRPNLILISIDSLRSDHLGCYGYDQPTSPALDRLAANGARFATVIAESSWTLPTHMTMLTGLSSQVHGVSTDLTKLADGHVTLAEALSASGYQTRGFWSGTYLHPIFGFGQGFLPGDYEGVIGDLVYDDPELDSSKPRFARQRLANMQTAISAVTTPTILERATDFLEHRGGEPFFLFLHLFDVHFDYNPPEAYWRRFDPDYDGTFTGENLPFNDAIHVGMNPRDLRHLIARYDGEIAFVDDHIGQLVSTLERLGLRDDTVVAITADHGDEFFEHGDKGHQKTLYDEVVKVPWIVSQPKRIPPQTIEGQVRHVDIVPTLLGLLRVPVPETLMGSDLAPVLLEGKPHRSGLTAVSRLDARTGKLSAMRTEGWKVITNRPRGAPGFVEYFRLSKDPGEKDSLSPNDEHAREAVKRLAEFSQAEARLKRLLGDNEGGTIELPPELARQLNELGY